MPVMGKRRILGQVFVLRSSKGQKPIDIFFVGVDFTKAIMSQLRKEYQLGMTALQIDCFYHL